MHAPDLDRTGVFYVEFHMGTRAFGLLGTI